MPSRFLLSLLFIFATLFPGTPVHAQTERVVFDAEVRVAPGESATACIGVEPGRFNVRTQAVGDPPIEPVHLSFYGYRGLDRDSEIMMTITRAESVATVPLTGGLYCYSVAHDLPASLFGDQADLTSHAQLLNLRMAIEPTN